MIKIQNDTDGRILSLLANLKATWLTLELTTMGFWPLGLLASPLLSISPGTRARYLASLPRVLPGKRFGDMRQPFPCQ